jgi:hypothetical protein
MRYRLACLALLGALAPAVGQSPEPEPIKLTIRPAAAPVPALKYRLLPEVRERTPGNAALLYYRAFSPEWWGYYRRELAKQVEKWGENRRQLPPESLRAIRLKGLEEVDLAARREYCEWQFTERVRKDGIAMLLPDVQGFREFGSLLAIRARLEVSGGHFDRAAYTLQTGFGLARDVADAPLLVSALVGLAISQIMLEQAEELIQAPGSPNLYWALTDLPRPFVSMRKPLEGERLIIDSLLPGFREMLAAPSITPLSPEQMHEHLDRVLMVLRSELGLGAGDVQARLGFAVFAARAYPEAKRFLIGQGRPVEQVEALPVLQVALLHEVYQYDRLYDEVLKWYGLPYPEARNGLEQADRLLKEHVVRTGGPGLSLAGFLMPAVQKVVFAGVRGDRRIAALRCVEAVRLYAAHHDGKLPASLNDITAVPVPADPLTGKGFEYRVSGDKVTLYGPPPPGEMSAAHNTVKYELTLQR